MARFGSRVAALVAFFLMVIGVVGRPVPYTHFEHSPFEGAQMQDIERLRLRGVSEKEIFARHATPYPVAVPAPNAPSQFSAFLHGLLSQTGIASERREDMEGVIAGKLTGSANAMKKDAEKRSVEEMDAVDDMHVEPKAAERLGEVQDAGAEKQNESQGTGKRWVAGERVQVEKTHTVKVFDGEGRRGGSANSKAVIEKRAVESDRENGGMEVHGQMGSLRGK